jgi:ligand-binding SRPBCC domain-containing protein
MTIIHLTTLINAEISRCFDAARDIDVHMRSAEGTNEGAVAGRTSGLCEAGDTITWEAKHFGITQRLTVEITQLSRPVFFEDKMLYGAFKSMRHEHHFEEKEGKTLMTDVFQYEAPFGFLGQWFDQLILKNYMTRFLQTRNRIIKSVVEENPSA